MKKGANSCEITPIRDIRICNGASTIENQWNMHSTDNGVYTVTLDLICFYSFTKKGGILILFSCLAKFFYLISMENLSHFLHRVLFNTHSETGKKLMLTYQKYMVF